MNNEEKQRVIDTVLLIALAAIVAGSLLTWMFHAALARFHFDNF